MTLQMHSDAAYLVAPKARSCVIGYHFLGNLDQKLFNRPIRVLAYVIKNLMSSAAKSIVTGIFMFMNVQEDVLILQ